MARTSAQLTEFSHLVAAQQEEQRHRWQLAQQSWHGHAAQAAYRRSEVYLQEYHDISRRSATLAQVIAEYIELYQQVEIMAWRASSQFSAAVLMPQLRTWADAIDLVCSLHIYALCAAEGTALPVRLADITATAEQVPLESIHLTALHTLAPEDYQTISTVLTEFPQRWDGPGAAPSVHLLEGGDGHFVAMVGAAEYGGLDPGAGPTSPARLSTFVPGVGSSAPESWATNLQRAARLAQESQGPVVLWSGYRAPDSVAHGAQRAPAQAAAPQLQRFQQSLHQRYPTAQLNVVGYSYGAVVLSHASAGLRADRVVLVGSPGSQYQHAAELKLLPTQPGTQAQVYAYTHWDDPISLGLIHGTNPAADSFGARPLPGLAPGRGGHTRYFEQPDFLRSLGQVLHGPA